MTTLTVHHLAVSSSERIPWLCEELGIPYTLKVYQRDPQTKMATPEYKALHPTGSAPVITSTSAPSTTQRGEETITLAESSACIQYICHCHAPSPSKRDEIFPSPTSSRYPQFLFWFHWSNATFQAALMRSLSLKNSGVDMASSKMGILTFARVQRCLEMLDERLRDNLYLAGGDSSLGEDGLTAADIMVVFSLTTFRRWYPYSLSQYPNILKYLKRVGQRDAYQKAMAKSDPGMDFVEAMGGEAPSPLW